MYFANPWGLFGLLAVPAIVLIHMYHRRFPPVLVAGLHLWGAEARVPSSGRKREKLPITQSLLLELLVAFLLTFVLAQPRLGDQDRVRHFVVVLDNSASMNARDQEGKSCRDKALELLANRVESSARGSVLTVILTGYRPEMLVGPTAPWDEAKAALEDWHPVLPRHESVAALDLASQFAEEGGELIFLTDSMPIKSSENLQTATETAGTSIHAIPNKAEVVALGTAVPNLAFTAARWTLDPKTLDGSLFLRIASFSPRKASVRIKGHSAGNVVLNQLIEIPANDERSLEAKLPGGLGQIEVTLSSEDDRLEIDNSIKLIEPKLRIVHVANVLPKDHAMNRALERVLAVIPDVSSSSREDAHLVIAPGGDLPESARELWWLGVGPLDTNEQAIKAAKDLLGPYLIEKRHPLLEGVILDGVVWGGVQPVELAVTPLVSAGQQLLLARLNGTLTTAFVMNIDIARSNLLDSPDWPILLSNLLELRRDALPGLRRWNFRMNEDIQFRLYEGLSAPPEIADKPLVLEYEKGTKQLAPSAVVHIPQLTSAGIYEIRIGGKSFGNFAVNFFDPAESNLMALRKGRRSPIEPPTNDGFNLANPLTWLMLLALIAILIAELANWRTLQPKI